MFKNLFYNVMKTTDCDYFRYLNNVQKRTLVQNKNGYPQELFIGIYNTIYPHLVKHATIGNTQFSFVLEMNAEICKELEFISLNTSISKHFCLRELFLKLLKEEGENLEVLFNYFLKFTKLFITVCFDMDIGKPVLTFSWDY